MVSDGAGGWFIGGDFSRIGAVAQQHRHIRSDGQLDGGFDPGADGRVTALARSGGTVYVGGLFGRIGGRQRRFLAALRASDGRATDWRPRVGKGRPGVQPGWL